VLRLVRLFEQVYDWSMSLPAAVVLRQQEIDDLETEVSVVAARLNRDHAQLVDLTRRGLDEERWAGGGIRSPEQWLVLHAGLSPARAADVVRLARRSTQLPTTVAAMTSGQVSMDQAAVVARYAPSSHEASIGELAPMTTVPQLRRALSRYQFGSEASEDGGSPDPVGRDERDVPGTEAFAAKAPELSMSYGDGRFVLRYSAPADIGALVEQAVREAKDALFTDGGTTASYADGLAEIASRSLASVRSGSRSARYRVYVHLSTDGSWVGGRGAIPPSLAAKFSCDGVVQPVWGSTARRSAWVANSGSFRTGLAGSSRTATGAACFRAVRPLGSWRFITSTTGPTAVRPTWTGSYACARSTMTPTIAVSSPSPAARSTPSVWFSGLRGPLRDSSSPTLADAISVLPTDPSRRGSNRESRSSMHTGAPRVSGCTAAGWTCARTDPR
jgi:hypothetical protein